MYKRNLDIQQAVKEFETETGFKVIRAMNRNKGSMKKYIFFEVSGVNYKQLSEEHYKVETNKHFLKYFNIIFIDRCLLNGNWNETDNSKARIDILKDSFKNVNWTVS